MSHGWKGVIRALFTSVPSQDVCAKKSWADVLFGGNLASHFNVDVVRVAEENDIYFVILPPNATHILQPLDVAVFSSLKQSWRLILDEWKREVRTEGAFNRQFFPSLLKRLINPQESFMQKNLQSGFRAYGIHPLQCSEPLLRLPSTTSLNVSESNSSLNKTLIGLLKNNRGCGEKKRQRRGGKDCPTRRDFILRKIWLLLNAGNLWRKKIKTHPQ